MANTGTVYSVRRNEVRIIWDGGVNNEPGWSWWLADAFEFIPPELDPTAGEGEV